MDDELVGLDVEPGLSLAVALSSEDLVNAANEWLVFASSEGTIRHAYDYWILGKGAEPDGPRWSIMRDVLGWGT